MGPGANTGEPGETMTTTYAGGRRIVDCDAHIMEPPGWLESHAPRTIHDRLAPLDLGDPRLAGLLRGSVEARDRRRTDPTEAARARDELMSMARKGWGAFGDGDPAERSEVLDLLGFERQVVYPTGSFVQVQRSAPEVFVEATRAMNRGLADFCAGDPRMVAVAYVPLRAGPDTAVAVLRDALADGCGAVMVDMVPAEGTPSHTHPVFDDLWGEIVDSGVCVTVHVGLDNGYRPVPPAFFDNDRELPHFRSDAPGDALSYIGIGYPAELFLASMVFDGVLSRHPGLRIGVAELGATWVPGFLRFLDHAHRAFRRLQDLSHLEVAPSELIRRTCRFAPFAGEDVDWMVATAGAELFMFSSDYPHHEGTDDPIGRFERTMEGMSERERWAFWADNAAWLLGPAVTGPR